MTKPLALLLFGAVTAAACSCLPPQPPRTALRESDAVFVGRVVAIERHPPNSDTGILQATLEIARFWKGINTSTVAVTTAASSAACGFSFQKDHTYLVYAYRRHAKLETDLCTRTKEIQSLSSEEKELGPAKKAR